MIASPEDMQHLANEWGFLPFFADAVPGFSIEENIDSRWWFDDGSEDEEDETSEDTMGAWDWKGRCILEGDLAYGKFFHGKAGYISMQYYPDYVNYRRSRYPLSATEEHVLATLHAADSLLSGELRRASGFGPRHYARRETNPLIRAAEAGDIRLPREHHKSAGESFETAVTRLQMGGRMLIADFDYRYDKQGHRYGWGIARYATPEDFFGPERLVTERTPEESRRVILSRLRELLPEATEAQLMRILG